MATFYSSPTGQRDGMSSLYVKEQQNTHSNPSVSSSGSMLYMHYPSSSAYSDMLVGITSQHDCIDLPASTTMILQDSSTVEPGSVASRIVGPSYSGVKDGRNEMLFIQTVGGSMSSAVDIIHNSINDDPRMDMQTQLGILNQQNSSSQQTNISSVHGQGLSLSLSTQIPVSSFQYYPATSDVGSCRDDDLRHRLINSNLSSCALLNLMSTIPNSKYLKATQRLLDEVVNVQKTVKQKTDQSQSLTTSGTTSSKDNDGFSKTDTMPLKTQEPTANSSRVLSPTERQDLQNKLTKLLAMLDEVDKRYKLYHHQMQIVVSSFDAIACCGAAKPYTSLALQTISQQFRSLRDAISGQVQSTQNSLGEQDTSGSKGGVMTRLRFVDQHLRQQRAIQQLGMFQEHAWRPQRGLPETSVSVLRAWLFEHFLHPYPTDAEKLMLSRQTGLTRSQISNWFINARVRLWKPMIEDIYKEEIGDIELDSNSLSDNAPKGRNEIRSSKDREDLQSSIADGHHMNQFSDSSKSSYISSKGKGAAAANFQNNATEDNIYTNLKQMNQRPNGEDSGILHDALTHSDTSGRFMTRQMSETGRYGINGVSLTLGMYSTAPPLGAEEANYDCMNLADQRHRFGPSHLIHDFVA